MPGFWSVFGLFGPFWSVSGPRGSVCRDIKAATSYSTRRIDPRYPEASTIFVYVDDPTFVEPVFGILRQSNPPISRMLAF